MNGGEYSLNNTFYLPPGLYDFGIQSAAGCEGEAIEVPVIKITDVVTPNGDGINDNWTIEGLQYLEDAKVQIYDRYGKVILEQDIAQENVFSWDATYIGRKLPSTSYWYMIKFKTLSGEPYTIDGYLLIKNRDSDN